ncbi:hypothetical protein ILYODFUR_001725 [Ilyodon furcidens]|uniref:Uncharacterized protein n=1 Tax=Ilyodon furcidens TaxID=33524 RepID=A0ABV0UZJ6_9TELE
MFLFFLNDCTKAIVVHSLQVVFVGISSMWGLGNMSVTIDNNCRENTKGGTIMLSLVSFYSTCSKQA